jgi:hypothetical protein
MRVMQRAATKEPRLDFDACCSNSQLLNAWSSGSKSHELVNVPATDNKRALDHLAKYITGFFVAFRSF